FSWTLGICSNADYRTRIIQAFINYSVPRRFTKLRSRCTTKENRLFIHILPQWTTALFQHIQLIQKWLRPNPKKWPGHNPKTLFFSQRKIVFFCLTLKLISIPGRFPRAWPEPVVSGVTLFPQESPCIPINFLNIRFL